MDFKDIYYSIMKERIKSQSLVMKDKEQRKRRRVRKDGEWKRLTLVSEGGDSRLAYVSEHADVPVTSFVSENIFENSCEDIVNTYEQFGIDGDKSKQNKISNNAITLAYMQSVTDFLLVQLELLKVKEEQIRCNWCEIEIETDIQKALKLKHRLSLEMTEEMNSSLTIL